MIKKLLSKLWNGIKRLCINTVKAAIIFLVDVMLLIVTSFLCLWWYGVTSGYIMLDAMSFYVVVVQFFMIGALMLLLIIKVNKKIADFVEKFLAKTPEEEKELVKPESTVKKDIGSFTAPRRDRKKK